MKRSDNLRWLTHNSKYSLGILCIIPLVCLMSSLCNIGISMIFKGYMDIAAGESSVTFFQMAIFSLSVIIVFALTQIASSVLEGYSYSKTEKGLRVHLVEQIFTKQLLKLNRMHTGEIQNRLTTDVAEIANFYIQLFGQMSGVFFTSLLAIITLFILNWKITLIFLIIVPLLTMLISLFSPKLQKAAEADSENEDANRSYMQELLTFLPLYQVYSMGKAAGKYVRSLYEKKTASKVKLSFLEGSLGFLTSLMSFGIFIIISAVGAYFVKSGENTIGDLVAMIQLGNYIMLPLIEAPRMITSYNKTVNSINRIREIEEMQDRITLEMTDGTPVDIDCIKLKHLSFGYNKEKSVLDDVNAVFTKGKTTGIIGKSGNGKSTLIKLILGLYTPIEDSMIEILNAESNQNYYNREGLISYVPSDNFVFSGTVKDNICMSAPFNKEKFDSVCRAANIDSLISGFALRENENIKEGGNNLSMGQKQRISIARALYAETSVLVFDEPTANLDSESVKLFTEMIHNFSKDKLCILVTHDDAVASICDSVYKLENKHLTLVKGIKV